MNELNNIPLSDEHYFNSYQFSENIQQNNFFNNHLQSQSPILPENQSNTLYNSEDIPMVQNSNHNFPFVRIHAFESHTSSSVANTSNSNSCNRNQNNDIKAEPIKSELSEAACSGQITQTTQTRPSSGSATPALSTEITNSNTVPQVSTSDGAIRICSPSTQTAKTQPIKLLKCSKCLFLCLAQINLDIHISSTHDENSTTKVSDDQMIACPGCENLFYSRKSFKSHLEYDHQMLTDDLQKYLDTLPTEHSSELIKKKNRIYLKNVECLREKPREVEVQVTLPPLETPPNILDENFPTDSDFSFVDLINDENQNLNDTTLSVAQSSTTPSIKKQKITIKSVETLREPIYQHNYFTSHNEIGEAFNSSNNKIFYDMDTGFPTSNIQTNVNNSSNNFLLGSQLHSNRNFDRHLNNCDISQVDKQQRAPKIYIKNVDILKEPIFLPSNNVTNILNGNETLNFNNIFTPPPPPVSSSRHQIPSLSMQSHLSSLALTTPSTTTNGQVFQVDANIQLQQFSNNSNFIYSNHEPLATNRQKSKIYIKNVDILKQPQFQESLGKKNTSNFLHLRTVDELNLLGKTELNMMNNLNQNSGGSQQENNLNPSSENSKNSDLEMSNGFELPITTHYNENADREYNRNDISEIQQTPISTGWTNSEYNNSGGFDSLDNFIDTNLGGSLERKSQQYYDLHTPQRSEMLYDNEIVETDNDDIVQFTEENENDLLFVCAEELIQNREECTDNHMDIEQISIDLDSNLVAPDVNNEDNNKNESNTVNVNVEVEVDLGNNDILTTPKHIEEIKIPELENINSENIVATDNNVKSGEKGRIYVSENLMENRSIVKDKDSTDEKIINSQKKHKGRPFGAKTFKKIGYSTCNDLNAGFKCDVMECGFRFKKLDTLEYHKKCHISGNLHAIKCPDCDAKEFSTWNTLHTHLWRSHYIDMDLYSCDMCNFKTPILSRLVNTHSKIHSEERNFKCELCEKAFKNAKQLKNHRRLHRKIVEKTIELYKCTRCIAVFSNQKSLKAHFCRDTNKIEEKSKCLICDKICSSKSALKLHLLIHDSSSKFKCDNCDYSSNDHNAFRRHKSTHDMNNGKMYECPYCDYKCIQSVLYKKHLNQKHPDMAANIIHRCSYCKFSTIKEKQYFVHLEKHKNSEVIEEQLNDSEESLINNPNLNITPTILESTKNIKENYSIEEISSCSSEHTKESCSQKIKVKSDQFLLRNSKDYHVVKVLN